MKIKEILEYYERGNAVFKPTTRLELIRRLQAKMFNVLHIEEGKAKDIAELVKTIGNKQVTVIILS